MQTRLERWSQRCRPRPSLRRSSRWLWAAHPRELTGLAARSEAARGEQLGARRLALRHAVHERPRVEPERGLPFVTDVGDSDHVSLNLLERIAALHPHRDAFLESDDALHSSSSALRTARAKPPRCGPPAVPAQALALDRRMA